MFEIIQKLAPAPPTGLYSPVAPLNINSLSPNATVVQAF